MSTAPTVEIGRTIATDPDLPMLASQAAIELELAIQGGSIGGEAMKELWALLENSIASEQNGKGAQHLSDPTTIALVEDAVTRASGTRPATLTQLVAEALEAVEKLKGAISPHKNTNDLPWLRDFCNALSQSASRHINSLSDLRPEHPFRR